METESSKENSRLQRNRVKHFHEAKDIPKRSQNSMPKEFGKEEKKYTQSEEKHEKCLIHNIDCEYYCKDCHIRLCHKCAIIGSPKSTLTFDLSSVSISQSSNRFSDLCKQSFYNKPSHKLHNVVDFNQIFEEIIALKTLIQLHLRCLSEFNQKFLQTIKEVRELDLSFSKFIYKLVRRVTKEIAVVNAKADSNTKKLSKLHKSNNANLNVYKELSELNTELEQSIDILNGWICFCETLMKYINSEFTYISRCDFLINKEFQFSIEEKSFELFEEIEPNPSLIQLVHIDGSICLNGVKFNLVLEPKRVVVNDHLILKTKINITREFEIKLFRFYWNKNQNSGDISRFQQIELICNKTYSFGENNKCNLLGIIKYQADVLKEEITNFSRYFVIIKEVNLERKMVIYEDLINVLKSQIFENISQISQRSPIPKYEIKECVSCSVQESANNISESEFEFI